MPSKKLSTTFLLVASLKSLLVNAVPCLETFDVTADECSYDALESALQDVITASGDGTCGTALEELMAHLAVSTKLEVQQRIADACTITDVPFGQMSGEGHIFDKEYFDGGTYWNEQRKETNEYGIDENKLRVDPGSRIRQIKADVSETNGISWPDNLDNFEDCQHRAAMCCFVQDRQANDGNGNCADDDCEDADPADNTDICYVDMERAPTSSRTTQGYAIFEKNSEDASHCHGLAWSVDPSDKSSRFKGNNLFFVSMYDHLTQRGYVRNAPGAPMCGCIEKMPVVTRSDCTQIDIVNENVQFSYSADTGLRADITNQEIEFNSCQGANNNNNDLAAYYEQLIIEGKATREEKDEFDKHIVGQHYCREAIDSFLDDQDLVKKPACLESDPLNCGCEEVLQKDYRGYRNVTVSGKTCQRWDTQAPHSHTRTRRNYPDAYLSDNFCRNPDNEPGGAWCYTTDPNSRWEYCGVQVCGAPAPTPSPTPSPTITASDSPTSQYGCPNGINPSDETCGCPEVRQADYRGMLNVTVTGKTCQMWSVQTPHRHSRTNESYPNKGIGDHNYCRNPDGEPGAWCYTTDPNSRWEYCDVPLCMRSLEPEGASRNLRG